MGASFARRAEDTASSLSEVRLRRKVRICCGNLDLEAYENESLGAALWANGIKFCLEVSAFTGHLVCGKLLAEQIVDGKASVSIEPLSLERFIRRVLQIEKTVVGWRLSNG